MYGRYGRKSSKNSTRATRSRGQTYKIKFAFASIVGRPFARRVRFLWILSDVIRQKTQHSLRLVNSLSGSNLDDARVTHKRSSRHLSHGSVSIGVYRIFFFWGGEGGKCRWVITYFRPKTTPPKSVKPSRLAWSEVYLDRASRVLVVMGAAAQKRKKHRCNNDGNYGLHLFVVNNLAAAKTCCGETKKFERHRRLKKKQKTKNAPEIS